MSHDGVDVDQLDFNMVDNTAFVCETDHVTVSVTVFIVVAAQFQALVTPVLWDEMLHQHAFSVSCSDEGGDEENHGASVIF